MLGSSDTPTPGLQRGRWEDGGGARGRAVATVTSLERVKITFHECLAYLSLANLTLVSEALVCGFRYSIVYMYLPVSTLAM